MDPFGRPGRLSLNRFRGVQPKPHPTVAHPHDANHDYDCTIYFHVFDRLGYNVAPMLAATPRLPASHLTRGIFSLGIPLPGILCGTFIRKTLLVRCRPRHQLGQPSHVPYAVRPIHPIAAIPTRRLIPKSSLHSAFNRFFDPLRTNDLWTNFLATYRRDSGKFD